MTIRVLDDPRRLELNHATTAALEGASALVERGERHLAALARLVELGMELVEVAAETAKARLRAEAAGEAPVTANPLAAFSQISQTVRRGIWLESRLAEGLDARRLTLAKLRDDREQDHVGNVDEIVEGAVEEVAMRLFGKITDKRAEALIKEARDRLDDHDDFRDYLDRSPGETIVRLCESLGLDPDLFVHEGDRLILAPLPPFDGEGQAPKAPGWGAPRSIPDPTSPARPPLAPAQATP